MMKNFLLLSVLAGGLALSGCVAYPTTMTRTMAATTVRRCFTLRRHTFMAATTITTADATTTIGTMGVAAVNHWRRHY